MKYKYQENNLPVYEIVIDPEDNTGIRFVSIVQDPAIELKGMYFSEFTDNQIDKNFQFSVNKDSQMIVGPALVPNFKIYREDEQGEYYLFFTPNVIKTMVDKFNANNPSGKINFNHSNQMISANIVGSWIVADSMYDKSKFYGFDLPVGAWFIEVHVDDPSFWKDQVKENGFYSFSVEGIMGQRLVEMSRVFESIIDELTYQEMIDLLKDI